MLRSISTNTQLRPYVESFLDKFNESCGPIPSVNYEIEWDDDDELHPALYAETTVFYDVEGNPTRFNIVFNSRFQWWDGYCYNKPSSHDDLKSTVMHEVLHGLGFMSSITENKRARPNRFDMLLRDSDGHAVVVGNNFTTDFGEPIYIENIRMYNPSPYSGGKSLSHEHNLGLLMSYTPGLPSKCHRHLDHSTKIILNRLGYNCSLNSTSIISTNDISNSTSMRISTNNILGIVAAVVLLILAVVFVCRSQTKGRKKRDFTNDAE
tara:strand:- start:9771 stop:10565 length:795 start_codon:yes stop_codon:yes gene_type:complete